jgi:hypothetical protein
VSGLRERVIREVEHAVNFHGFDAAADMADFDMAAAIVDARPEPDGPSLVKFIAAERDEAWEEGVRQAIEWLRAGYEYGTGPDWREDGCEWIADHLTEHRRAALCGDDPTPAPTRCRWSESRERWEREIRPGVSKEACGHRHVRAALPEARDE